jgi:hypothetical protein
MRAVPFSALYPGIRLTTEGKPRKTPERIAEKRLAEEC